MILTHGGNCVSVMGNFVIIGDKKYKTTTIGNRTWLAENLDYKFDGLTMSQEYSTTNAYASYFGQSGMGLYYNGSAAILLNNNKSTLLPDGWRVPTPTDFNNLLSYGGYAGKKLKTTYGWDEETWNGTDDYGFSAYPCGRIASKSVREKGKLVQYWSTNRYEGTYEWYQSDLHLEGDNMALVGSQTFNMFLKIRLVKDAV